ncbi:DUF3566 domain-containing protein [Catenuloplanes indicus]|uniref:DUF3566 domain-containing protein n=1 Tax=Catenuloplanes indicus TaxID=137267 RepID=A0AAE3W1U9_9ACTN|nr:DUF3566 domain-containing protein [Catenuloplanes indicus]MDQ0367775.1 hypothetical protein [Catenuloplanes indicus]
MTETQATSGAGTSATPAGKDSADGDAKAKGRAVVGRAVVGPSTDAPSPKFTRAPGMKPPPDEAPAGSSSTGTAKPATPSATGDKDTVKPVIVPAGKPASASSSTSTSTSASASAKAAPAKPATPPKASPAAAGSSPSSPPGERTERIPASVGTASSASTTGGLSGLGSKVSGAVRGVGAARVTDTIRAARNAVGGAAARGPRRARLNVKRIDPWSVMKFSFAVSLVLFIVVIVATSVLYLALDAMGVFQSVNETLAELVTASGGDTGGGSVFKITAKGVIGTSALIGLVNVVLFTALATLGAFIYNVCADLVGGVELTLAERD